MDTDTDTDVIEQPEPLLSPDSFKAVRDLIALVVDPRAVKRNLRQLHDGLAAISAAQLKLDADRAAWGAQQEKERAELVQERAVLLGRRQRVEQDEASIAQQREDIAKLERAWSGLRLPGEPPEFMVGSSIARPQAYTALQRARHYAEHGVPPDHPDKPIEHAEPVQSVEEPRSTNIRRGVGDAGDWPSNVSLTRAPDESEQRIGVRVRSPRKGAAHAE